MNNFIKENWFKRGTILVVLIIIGGFFYWHELRPAQIKKECSWVKVVIPEQQQVTKEEALASLESEEYKECLEKNKNNIGGYKSPCDILYLKKEQDYISEKIYYREAQKTEYDFCLHSKGL